MEVSNSSLYDGGSAVTEAVLMCLSVTKRMGNVVVAGTIHPEYLQILRTYLQNLETQIREVPAHQGTVDAQQLESRMDGETACVVIQQPNFFGRLEQVKEIAAAARRQGVKCIVSCDPLSLGVLARPGDLGADVVVAEGQSLGSPMAYGGPYLGILACREEFLRRMPGRLVGQTVDRRGRRCWVLTLQTREQHIRRDKATSNICTNQGLLALRASVYLSLLGPQGLRELSELCVRKTQYAMHCLTDRDRFELAFPGPCFKEFVIRDREGDVASLLRHASEQGILAGIPLATWFPELRDCFLVAVTEQRTRSQIDRWATVLEEAPVAEAVSA
jgi:glycine dehydrogenase subunit 1